MKTACIYHAECIDGAAAAAVVRHKYPDAELLPAKPGDPLPQGQGSKRVFIVDFSFASPVLQRLKKEAAEVHWYDHHKTALPIQKDIGFGVIDLRESGATLTWKQLFPKKKVPKILQYVRDKDIWLWELPNSREISADIGETEGILDPAHRAWKRLLKGPSSKEWKAMVERGRRSERILKESYRRAVKRGFAVDLEGVRGLAVNWTQDSSSLGEHIYKELGYPVAIIFSYHGKEWNFSLRSDRVDVSEIALKFGGGGHAGAAGFRTKDIEWLLAKKIVS